MPASFPLIVHLREALVIDWLWLEQSNQDDPKSEYDSPIDMTGWTGIIRAYDRSGDELFNEALTLGSDGTITAIISGSENWGVGIYKHKATLTDTGGVIQTLIGGSLCVKDLPDFTT